MKGYKSNKGRYNERGDGVNHAKTQLQKTIIVAPPTFNADARGSNGVRDPEPAATNAATGEKNGAESNNNHEKSNEHQDEDREGGHERDKEPDSTNITLEEGTNNNRAWEQIARRMCDNLNLVEQETLAFAAQIRDGQRREQQNDSNGNRREQQNYSEANRLVLPSNILQPAAVGARKETKECMRTTQ